MKRVILTMGTMLAVTCAVMADGNAFTPLNFNDTAYDNSNNTVNLAPSLSTDEAEAIGNGSIQNAILQLDNAQVDIRNDLLNCKTKYADVDAQYKLIKTERQALKKQISSIERRIKDIDKAKERIRKNML